MVAKVEIVEQLGEGAVLLPGLIEAGLAANDRLKIRLTLGTIFLPSRTSGLVAWCLSLPAVKIASDNFIRSPLSTTELAGTTPPPVRSATRRVTAPGRVSATSSASPRLAGTGRRHG